MTDIFGISKTGGRPYNQDAAALVTFGGKSAAVVCDGLGAYAGSDIASEIAAAKAVADIKKEIIRGEDVISPALLTKTVKSAHTAILKRKGIKGDFLEGCATIALLTYDGIGAAAATVGDTRVYFIRGGLLEYRSRDHSLAQAAVDRGEILPNRVGLHSGQNKLTKVIGSDTYSPPDIHEFRGPFNEGDTFLLVSDGVWSMVTDSELTVAAAEAKSARDLVLRIEALIADRIRTNSDNYTAVALRISNGESDGAIITDKDKEHRA